MGDGPCSPDHHAALPEPGDRGRNRRSTRLPRPAARPRPGWAAGGGVSGGEPADPVRQGRIVTVSNILPVTGTSAANAAPAATGVQLLTAFPPRPATSSWPAAGASRSAVLARVLAAPFALGNPAGQQARRLGVLAVLNWLQTASGDSWQQRWQASGAEDQADWRDVITAASAGRSRARTAGETRLPHLSSGLLVLICADVIRPSLGWLLRSVLFNDAATTE